MARDANKRQLLGSIEHDALLRCSERPLGAPHMRWPPSRGALRLLYTHRTPSRRVPLARRPPAAAAASPPLTRACLISAYSEIHSGRPLERAPRLARAHHAAVARPSAAQAPSRVPSRRFIARDAPPCGARRKPETAARVDRARRSTSLRRTTSRRATHALAAFARRAAPPLHAPHAFAPWCLWREGRLQPQSPLRLSHEHASSRHTQRFIAAARSSAPRASLGFTGLL